MKKTQLTEISRALVIILAVLNKISQNIQTVKEENKWE